MIIYVFLLLACFLLFRISKDKTKSLIISFILITLVAALRKYTVGADTVQFYSDFSNIITDSSWNYNNFRYEPGFYYLCKLLGLITSDPQILLIITSIIINFSVYKFIKNNSNDYCLSAILYILMLYFFSNMNIMRQALALSILLFGFNYLKEKKYLKYIIVVAIASLFHTVAFASLLLLVFLILPNKKMVYFIQCILACISFVFYKQLFKILSLGFGYESYATSEFGVSNYFGSVLSALEIFAIGLLLIVFSERKKEDSKNDVEKILTIAYILYIWFSFLTIRMNIFNRISGLFGIYNIVFIPYLLKKILEKNETTYFMLKFVCLCVYMMSFFIISIYRPEWYGAIPYYFFWQ